MRRLRAGLLGRLPAWARRFLPLLLAVVGVSAGLSVSVFLTDQPIYAGEPSPRTVVAPDLIRIEDPEATDRARREAADLIEPVLVDDPEAKAAIVQKVRDVFAAVAEVREPAADGQTASARDQRSALAQRLPDLQVDRVQALVALDDETLASVSAETLSIAQQLARQRIPAERLETATEEQLRTELAVRSFPEGVAETVVEPVIRSASQPTVIVDDEATVAAQEQAAAAVSAVTRSFPAGAVVVSAGEVVDAVQLAALRQRGLEGAEPWREAAKAIVLAIVLTLAVAAYLRAYRPRVWSSWSRLVLLSCLFIGLALIVEAVTLLAPTAAAGWGYLLPAGAIAMLATILFDPPVGVLSVIPTVVIVAFAEPGEGGVVAFTAIAGLLSVPLVSRLSARGDLRRAAWQSTLAYVALAGLCAAVFNDLATVRLALLAGLANGVLVAMLVNTSLPFLESLFGVVTATSLLDLADRNHPLLRELEQKALGSYNHSIMVATLCERAARAIGADALLASTAALYHDIGKVRRPWFFVENQFGIANPHDDLEPGVSAVIIQEHVTDGITMARSHRLPPEIVDGIATHHGTTLVSYFHRKALAAAAASGGEVDEAHYRYQGRRPASREMAVLMLADCCEGASRAAAQHNRNLSRKQLEDVVRSLIADRVDDGQLDASALTFAELKTVTASFIDTLVGVYHPRIAYPDPVAPTLNPESVEP
ncbi:MAG: HDIG domain-containing protein [Actinomycetota bacterium]|nr:HDIG domain-containing protein [Euzebyaceae bacterium]MDQ3528758.1 HDIG domain-containing protein [Actinomycetota bacterium]